MREKIEDEKALAAKQGPEVILKRKYHASNSS